MLTLGTLPLPSLFRPPVHYHSHFRPSWLNAEKQNEKWKSMYISGAKFITNIYIYSIAVLYLNRRFDIETVERMHFPILFSCGVAAQSGPWSHNSWRFLDHKHRRTTVGRTPLCEWSGLRRDNTRNRQTSVPLAEFEPTISAGERPQTYALDRAATGTGRSFLYAR